MKTLLLNIALFIGVFQFATAQNLYVQTDINQEFQTQLNQFETSFDAIEKAHQDRSLNENINRTLLTKQLFMMEGKCKGIAGQAVNAKQITADMMTKHMMLEPELAQWYADLPQSGYYAFSQETSLQLATLVTSLSNLRQQMKANGYRFHAGLDNADQNLDLLKRFKKTYSKFVEVLQNSYTDL